jgi:hypothetical protein
MLNTTQSLVGLYRATVGSTPCEIQLELDKTGCLSGAFSAESERLEIVTGLPKNTGEFFGTIRTHEGDSIAVFKAIPKNNDLMLEINAPSESTVGATAKHVLFKRLINDYWED